MKKALRDQLHPRKNDPREYCRTCGHPDWMHVRTWYWACGREPRDEIDAMYSNTICQCKEYLPEDNLEYLEVVYAKRSLT